MGWRGGEREEEKLGIRCPQAHLPTTHHHHHRGITARAPQQPSTCVQSSVAQQPHKSKRRELSAPQREEARWGQRERERSHRTPSNSVFSSANRCFMRSETERTCWMVPRVLASSRCRRPCIIALIPATHTHTHTHSVMHTCTSKASPQKKSLLGEAGEIVEE